MMVEDRFECICLLLVQKYEVAAKSQLKKQQKIWQRECNKAADRAVKDVSHLRLGPCYNVENNYLHTCGLYQGYS